MCDTLIHLVSILVGYASHVSRAQQASRGVLTEEGLEKDFWEEVAYESGFEKWEVFHKVWLGRENRKRKSNWLEETVCVKAQDQSSQGGMRFTEWLEEYRVHKKDEEQQKKKASWG